MKIAVIGDSVVGRVLANLAARRAEVTVFSYEGRYRPHAKPACDTEKIEGLNWAFPTFAVSQGSMPVWGGVLAVPGQALLDEFQLSVSHTRLFSCLLDCFQFETLYGRDVGDLSHLFKARPHVKLADAVKQVRRPVSSLREREDTVEVIIKESEPGEIFDYCFIATGAVSRPCREGNVLYMQLATDIGDKVISISERTGPAIPQFERGSEIARLSIPICIPVGANKADARAVFSHILAEARLKSVSSVVGGYLRNSHRFVLAAFNKIAQRNRSLWFNTWSGVRQYPLVCRSGVTTVDEPLLDKFQGELFMPALHSDVRLPDDQGLGRRIHTEHFVEGLPPIPFNPIVMRLAKLLAALDGIA